MSKPPKTAPPSKALTDTGGSGLLLQKMYPCWRSLRNSLFAGIVFLGFVSNSFANGAERPDRGKVIYEGTYSGRQTEGLRILNMGSDLEGAITITLQFDGQAVRASYRTTGRFPSGSANGLVEGTKCKLFGNRELVIEGECDGSKFAGTLTAQPSPDRRTKLSFNLVARVDNISPAVSKRSGSSRQVTAPPQTEEPELDSGRLVVGFRDNNDKVNTAIPRDLAEMLRGHWQGVQKCSDGHTWVAYGWFFNAAEYDEFFRKRPARDVAGRNNSLGVWFRFLKSDQDDVLLSPDLMGVEWRNSARIAETQWDKGPVRIFNPRISNDSVRKTSTSSWHKPLDIVSLSDTVALTVDAPGCDQISLSKVDESAVIRTGDLAPGASAISGFPDEASTAQIAARLLDTAASGILIKKSYFVRYRKWEGARRANQLDNWALFDVCLKTSAGCSGTAENVAHAILYDINAKSAFAYEKLSDHSWRACRLEAGRRACSTFTGVYAYTGGSPLLSYERRLAFISSVVDIASLPANSAKSNEAEARSNNELVRRLFQRSDDKDADEWQREQVQRSIMREVNK